MATKPKLYIEYYYVYDHYMHVLRREKYKPSTETKLRKYAYELHKRWHRKYNDKVFKLISQISGLKWKRKEIDAYIVKKTIPFSNPLTLHYTRDFDEQVEIIIHELCHVLLNQHYIPKVERVDKKLTKIFKKEHKITIDHLLIYAIEIPTLQKLFSKKKIEKFLKATKTYWQGKYYWRAVQLVKEKTPKYFLKMLK